MAGRASCRAAQLSGQTLTGAFVPNLSQTLLLGAKLTGANTAGTIFCNAIVPDGSIGGSSRTGCPSG